MGDDDDLANAFFVEAFTPEHRDDPYDLYRRMRQQRPFVTGADGTHLAFGHDECWATLRHPGVSSDERHSAVFHRLAETDDRLATAMKRRPLLVFMDPPDHTRLRALVTRAFTPRRVEQLRTAIQDRTDELVAALHTEGAVDLVEGLASPLPIAIVCDLLGIPAADHSFFRAWSAALTKSIDPGVLRSEADNLAIDRATAELGAYTATVLRERRRRPGDDLISDLVERADDRDRLQDDELADLVLLLLVAGHETTVNLIGNGLHALLDHPAQLAAWPRHRAPAERAVDELLRYDAPLQMVQRTAVDDVTIGQHDIRAGEQIIVMIGAANRDPAVFADPDRLDLERQNANRHVSFGGGIHHCLGATLARAEGAIAITTLLRAFPSIERAAPAPLRDTFNIRGRAALPTHLSRC